MRDPTIDIDEIRRVVATGIKQRRDYAQSHSIDFEQLIQPTDLTEEAKRWTLDLLAHHKATLLIKPYTPSPGQGVWGHFLLWLKKQAHNLVIYYVNLLGRKQILFNESVAEAIAIYQAQIESLQEKVSNLEEKIQSLEARLAARETQTHE